MDHKAVKQMQKDLQKTIEGLVGFTGNFEKTINGIKKNLSKEEAAKLDKEMKEKKVIESVNKIRQQVINLRKTKF